MDERYLCFSAHKIDVFCVQQDIANHWMVVLVRPARFERAAYGFEVQF